MERYIKDMKQLERRLSGNPNPEVRFLRHAAINALLASHPVLPGAEFLAGLPKDLWRAAERRLAAKRQKVGLSRLIRRNPERFAALILERWKQSSRALTSGSEAGVDT